MVMVSQSLPSVRAEFIRKTYTHLAGAVGLFIGIEFLLFTTGIAQAMFSYIVGNQLLWLGLLGAFMLAGWFARSLAANQDEHTQYIGLGVYVLAEALIFAPLLYIAAMFSTPDVIPTAAVLTLCLFAGLTAIVFTTRRDFSFLGSILKVAGLVALGLIACSLIFGFSLGLIFSAAMVIFAGAAILYDTSNVLHRYQPGQHVAAALQLFASVALLFWYVLRIVMALSSRR